LKKKEAGGEKGYGKKKLLAKKDKIGAVGEQRRGLLLRGVL